MTHLAIIYTKVSAFINEKQNKKQYEWLIDVISQKWHVYIWLICQVYTMQHSKALCSLTFVFHGISIFVSRLAMEAFEYNDASKNCPVKNNTRVWQIVYFILWITSVTYEAQWNPRGNIYCKYTNTLGQPIKCQTPILAELVWKNLYLILISVGSRQLG